MIRFLGIQRLAVIDELEIEFGPGFTVVTGETGAGKSIIVEAMALLLGARATSDLVRTGAETATIQASLERADGSEIVVRREISAQGRSRAFIDGNLVTSAALREGVGDLVDLHGQHEYQSLLAPQTQLALLDAFGSLEDRRAAVGHLFAEKDQIRLELERVGERERDRAARVDLLELQRREIDKVAPRVGEDDALAAERQVVANADKLSRLCGESYAALYEDDHAVLSGLSQVWKRVGELALLDVRFQPYVDARETIRPQLEELAFLLRDYAASLDASPERLQQIEDRLANIERLKRRYGPTLEAVLARRAVIDLERAALEEGAERAATLGARLTALNGAYLAAARALSDARRDAAKRFTRALVSELNVLAMTGTRCEARFEALDERPDQWGPTGVDRMEMLFSANPGEELRPLVRIASGGELSRVMLAIKTLATTDVPGKTLVFDEVDAGIGGRVADVVGQRLGALARRCQVLCVTHLPQVAAHGDIHFLVTKDVADNRTMTRVERLNGDRRIEEVARMMGGHDVTPHVRAGARDLVEARQRRRQAKGESEKAKPRR
jgi:DNA repair protein RecN (Recombination protein N)